MTRSRSRNSSSSSEISANSHEIKKVPIRKGVKFSNVVKVETINRDSSNSSSHQDLIIEEIEESKNLENTEIDEVKLEEISSI